MYKRVIKIKGLTNRCKECQNKERKSEPYLELRKRRIVRRKL